MQVHAIDQNQVQVLCPHCDPVLQFFAVEKQWFSTGDNKLLGVVLYLRTNNDWAYVIFGPNLRGCYRWIAGESNIPSQIQAAAQLQAEMQRIAETGQEVFRRPLQRLLRSIKTVTNRRRVRRAARRAVRNTIAAQNRWPAAS
jgi:hypothetical protein